MSFLKKITENYSKEKSVISLFRERGVLSVELAKKISEIGEVNRSVFNKLYEKGIIERGGGDTFFLNEHELMRYKMARTKWAIILLFTIITVIMILSQS